MTHNKPINLDSEKRRACATPLFAAGYGRHWRGSAVDRNASLLAELDNRRIRGLVMQI